MADKITKSPQIRFAGFADAWEQRRLVHTVEEVLDYRGKSPTKFGMEWGNKGYLVLSALNVKDGYIDKSVEAKYGDQELFEMWMGERRLEKGDVLFTTEAPLGNVAQVPDDEGYILNQRTVAFKTDDKKTNNDFLAQLLRSPLVQERLNANASGGTAKGIGMKEFSKLTAYVSSQVEEQKKIGAFFSNLDNLITLHQRKLELLKDTKKSLLQKMFPKDGANVPEIRFEGFTDAWEQRTVSELADRYDNLRVPITASDRVAGSTPYYGANGIQDYVEGFTHDGEFILVAEDGANDLRNYPIQYVNGKVWVNNHAHVLQAKSEIADNKFLMNAMKHTNIEPYLVGGGRAKLNADVMMKISFRVPELAEQKQIGLFFANLDHLITLQQRELSPLKKLKKLLLQQMFV